MEAIHKVYINSNLDSEFETRMYVTRSENGNFKQKLKFNIYMT